MADLYSVHLKALRAALDKGQAKNIGRFLPGPADIPRLAKKQVMIAPKILPDAGKELCDELWYIYAEENVRRERLKASRGYTDERITQMIASQPGEERFRSVCTAVIDNSGDFEDTKRQIGERLGL